MIFLARFIGTVAFVGYVRPAPGTWGSLVALPWGWALHQLGGAPLLIAGIVLVFLAGWWATRVWTAQGGDSDPSEIVADEVVGQWIAILPLSLVASARGIDVLAMWPGWIAAFVLFRLFDIWKPWLVGWADRLHSPLGVMLDDVFAGLFAAAAMLGLAAFAHGVLM